MKPKKRRPKKKRKKRPKGKVYAVNIAVQNEPEGASFRPQTMDIPVSENPNDLPEDGIIAAYPAINVDSGLPSEDVSYAKGYDPDNLLSIDPETAEIRLLRAPDRESPFVKNGTYIAKILAMDPEISSRTATGTIALQVADVNDNCPSLNTTLEYVCTDTEVIPIAGFDPDGDPNGAPFSFKLVPESSRGDWELRDVDDLQAKLVALSPLWPGSYEVAVQVWDQQGLSCPEPQVLEVQVCLCEGGEHCGPGRVLEQRAAQKDSAVGAGGLGAIMLGLIALIVAAALLVTCGCGAAPGAFSDIPIFTEDHLMVYHTEGQGEDKEFPLLGSPVHMAPSAASRDLILARSVNTVGQTNMASAFSSHMQEYELGSGGGAYGRIRKSSFGDSGQSQGEVSLIREGPLQIEDMVDFALPDIFLHEYYTQKSCCVTTQDPARDSLLVYNFEGRGSLAGSVDRLSGLDFGDDLSFLNNLELKFKTLADICAPPSAAAAIASSSSHSSVRSMISKPSPPLSLHQHPPTASIAPTLSTARESAVLTKSSALSQSQNFSTLSKISQQSVQDRSAHATIQRSKSLANLAQDTSLRSLKDQRLQSTSIIQLPPATIAPAMSQTMLMQQQPIYYITSPVMQSSSQIFQPAIHPTSPVFQQTSPVFQPQIHPTSPVFQPAMHYVVQQPSLQNAMVFAEPQAANMQGLVLLQNRFGSMEQLSHPASAMALGGRRYMSVIDLSQSPETEPTSPSRRAVKGKGKAARRASESRLSSAVSMSGLEVGGVQRSAAAVAEEWLAPAGYTTASLSLSSGQSPAARKSRRRMASMAELSEQVDGEEEVEIEDDLDSLYRRCVQLNPGNYTTMRY